MQNKNNNKAGFTIIETMIAVALFLIVVTIGMGSLLNTVSLQQKSQDMRSIMDNLSFIMEDMSRNLRTGYSYNGGGTQISFTASSGSIWVYTITPPNIFRSIGGQSVQLNPEEVKINGTSSFTIIGSNLGDNLQPFVTIKLVGKITYKGVDTPFSLQTSVSQRLADITP